MIYTIDNPKLVNNRDYFKGKDNFTGLVKDRANNIVYYLNGQYHREDGPAFEEADGSKFWYLNNKTDGPAVEYFYGSKEWYLNGEYHREDGPAIEDVNGDKWWYLNDECYGENDDFTNESWIRFVQLQLLK